VPPPTPEQLRRREQFEGVIRLVSPALNLVLAVGERVSRVVEREDVDYYPPRMDDDAPPGHSGKGEPARS
jgi:hypothetical protein